MNNCPFDSWATEIESYCSANNLDYNKLKHEVKSWSTNDLIFLHHEKNKGLSGLLDETPMPITLKVIENNGELFFEQTENTLKYLAIDKENS